MPTLAIGECAQEGNNFERRAQSIFRGVQLETAETLEIQLEFAAGGHRHSQENAVIPGDLSLIDGLNCQINYGRQAELLQNRKSNCVGAAIAVVKGDNDSGFGLSAAAQFTTSFVEGSDAIVFSNETHLRLEEFASRRNTKRISGLTNTVVAQDHKFGSPDAFEARKWKRRVRMNFIGLGETAGEIQGSAVVHALNDDSPPIEQGLARDGSVHPSLALGPETGESLC